MRAKTKIRAAVLPRAVDPLRQELGKANQDRLDALIRAYPPGAEKVRLSDCLRALFPGQPAAQQLNALRTFRKALNDAARQQGVDLAFCVDTKLRDPPEDRYCWFAGADPTADLVGLFSEQSTADVGRGPLIRSRALATDAAELENRKRRVIVFVSYASEDAKSKEDLLARLIPHLDTSARYNYVVWHDREIGTGQKWREEIGKALAGCGFGLLLVSPNFLRSEFITREELPWFVGPRATKPALPVALGRFDFRATDLLGIEEHQVFRHKKKCFEQCRDDHGRKDFAFALFQAIEKRLDDDFRRARLLPLHRPGRVSTDEIVDEAMRPELECDKGLQHWVRSRAKLLDLRQMESRDLKVSATEAGVDAVEALKDWALSPDPPPFYAVLGEYGIGKTTTLKQLTRALLDLRRQKPETPLPIYVDLRLYVENSAEREGVPSLREILAGVIQRSWKLDEPARITADDLIRLVRQEGALVIFDGLDEKIVHLRPERAKAFIRELWSILPPYSLSLRERAGVRAASEQGVLEEDSPVLGPVEGDSPIFAARKSGQSPTRKSGQSPTKSGQSPTRKSGQSPGKLVLSCRSHYFKDVWSQNAMLTGEDRDGLKAADYRALVMLPFNEDQVREYLGKVVGAERVEAVMELFGSVHNLRELAERPYLLAVLADDVGTLEGFRAVGRPVRSVDVYQMLVRRWLGRDAGKHHFSEADKQLLMEALAAALARDGQHEWPWERLERWLNEFLQGDQQFAFRYRNQDPDVLDEDFRTATFILRPDLGESRLDRFRFAHTSLHEYFLARHLHRALEENAPERWALAAVSDETLDFLGELLAEPRPGDPALAALDGLLARRVAGSTRLAFRYWLRAIAKGWPEPAPERVDLAGEDLDGWQIAGHSADRPLVLTGANLAGASLARAELCHVDLSQADLTRASLPLATLDDVRVSGARADGADFTGSTWHACDLTGLSAADATWWDAHGIDSQLSGASLPPDFPTAAAWVTAPGWEPPQDAFPMVGPGHRGPVTACAWSPDGRRIVSASSDRTLRVWDAQSGRSLLQLSGHTDGVMACAWSPDGRRIVSASDDSTLRVWDAQGGVPCPRLRGHAGDDATSEHGQASLAMAPRGRSGARACEHAPYGLLTLYLLPGGNTCSVDEPSRRVKAASAGAWRYLTYSARCPLRQALRSYPCTVAQ